MPVRSGGPNTGLARFFQVISDASRGALGLPALTGAFAPGQCVTMNAEFAPVLTNDSFSEKNWSWRGIATWKPSNSTLFYASVSRGFKAGNYLNSSATFNAQYLAPVKQERLTDYEIGTKLTTFGRALQFNAALFYYDYRNKQLIGPFQDPVFGKLLVLTNIPKSSAKGADIELQVEPYQGLVMRGNLVYTDTKIKSHFILTNQDSVDVDVYGNRFSQTPKVTASGSAQYDWKIFENYTASLGADILYNSKTNAALTADRVLDMKAYSLIGVRAAIRDDERGWEASIWGRNITNKYYWTNASAVADTLWRMTGRPATYGVSFRASFK